MPDINSDIQYLKGVGPAYAKKFAKLGIYTIRDLLLHYPRRYIRLFPAVHGSISAV